LTATFLSLFPVLNNGVITAGSLYQRVRLAYIKPHKQRLKAKAIPLHAMKALGREEV
jgi:hypothetical protein